MNLLINCTSLKKINNHINLKLGGIESLNIELAEALSKKRINVTITSKFKRINKKGKIKLIPINHIKKNPYKFSFNSIISSNDATIFNYYPKCKNKIFWLHNKLQIEKSIRKKQFSSIIKNRPIAVFVSKYLEKKTSKLYFFKKRLVINNFLSPSFNTKKNNLKRNPIFVWSVQRDVGLNDTINMWKNIIYKKNPKAKFYVLGNNSFEKENNKRYLRTKNIFFLGRVNKNRLKEIYSKSTAMICLGYDETFCLNALEANSCGLPILTFGKTALNSYIKDNHNGFIVKDFDQLAKKILVLTNTNNSNYIKLSNSSFFHSKKYHLSNIIYNWLKLLK